MKHPLFLKSIFSSLVMIFIKTVLSANTVLIIDFGGNYVDTVSGVNRLLRPGALLAADIVGEDDGGQPIDLHISYFEFSLTDPLSPSPKSENPDRFNYDTSVKSAVFYGGAASFFANNPDRRIPEAAAIVDHGWVGKTDVEFDEIGLRGGNRQQPANNQVFEDNLRHHATFLWKKDDFLNGAADETVVFNEDSQILLTVSRKWHGYDDARFVVLDGDQLYISEFTYTAPPELIRHFGLTKAVTFSLNPTETTWALYSPSGFDLAFDTNTPFAAHNFNDVQAAGFYIGKNDLEAELTWITFSDFEVKATITGTGKISGIVWGDVNNNSQRDPTEVGLADQTLFIDVNNDAIFDEAIDVAVKSDASGNYTFDRLLAGTYVIRELLPDGFTHSFPVGENFYSVNIESGSSIDNIDFGNSALPGEIHGKIWNDTNSNGVADLGEPGIPGIRVYLDINDNGNFDSDEPTAITQLGSPDGPVEETGIFVFDNVIHGDYVVRESIPEGLTQTFPQEGNHNITLMPAGIVESVNFGNQGNLESISGLFWLDVDENGVKDEAESVINDVEARLYRDNGDQNFDENLGDLFIGFALTENGQYTFSPLSPGVYWVIFNDISVKQKGFKELDSVHVQIAELSNQPLNDINFRFEALSLTSEILLLKPGWNLISLSFEPFDPAVETVFSMEKNGTSGDERETVFSGSIWKWANDGIVGRLEMVNSVHALTGYWLYLARDTEISIDVNGYLVQDTNIEVKSGWNVVGPEKNIGIPSHEKIDGPYWTWNGTTFISESILEKQKGYWIHATENITIDMGQ